KEASTLVVFELHSNLLVEAIGRRPYQAPGGIERRAAYAVSVSRLTDGSAAGCQAQPRDARRSRINVLNLRATRRLELSRPADGVVLVLRPNPVRIVHRLRKPKHCVGIARCRVPECVDQRHRENAVCVVWIKTKRHGARGPGALFGLGRDAAAL